MKLIKLTGAALLAVCILVSSGCSSMTNTGKGALIGGGGGGAIVNNAYHSVRLVQMVKGMGK